MITHIFTTTSSDRQSQLVAKLVLPQQMKPKAILHIVHGITEHSDRYEELCDILTKCFTFGVLVYDQIGHGKSVSKSQTPMTIPENGWQCLVADVRLVKNECMNLHPELNDIPFVLFGFSLGSFVVRDYLTQNHDVQGAIIAGTGWQPKCICNVLSNIIHMDGKRHGRNIETKLTRKLLFDNYNKQFGKDAPPMSWLSEQSEVIAEYMHYPLTAKTASCGYFETLLQGMTKTCNRCSVSKIPNIPIMLIAGEHDPVGNNTKGVQTFKHYLLQTRHSDVTYICVKDARHDILHCNNKYTTVTETIMFLSKIASKYYDC